MQLEYIWSFKNYFNCTFFNCMYLMPSLLRILVRKGVWLIFQDTQFFLTTKYQIKSIIKSNMKSIDQVVSKVDIFAQPLEINFEPDKKHGIYLPFVATLALVLIISASTISSLVDLFSYKKVTMTGYRELFAKTDSINSTIPMVAIKVNQLTFKQFKAKIFSEILISDGIDSENVQNITLQPCTRNHWKNISEAEYKNYSVSDYYCPNNLDSYSIASTQISDLNRFFSLILRLRQSSDQEEVFSIRILLLNQKSVDKQKLAFQNRISQFYQVASYSSKDRIAIYSTMTISCIVTNIKDDSSFFPFSSPVNQRIASLDVPIYDSLFFNFSSNSNLPDLLIMRIYVSQRSIEYNRNVGKFTDVFAEAGGLYTVVFGIFSIVVLLYYNHKLRLKLAECTFKNSKSSIKPSDYGFIKSLRYGTRGILKPNENSGFANECKRIEKNLNEVNSLVHIETILNRLQIIESTLESLDKDKFACTRLFQKSSVRKIQRKRLSIEYYEYIVHSRTSITLRDARKIYNGLGMSLEDFLNRRLKHRMKREMKTDEGKDNLGQSVQTNNGIVNAEIEGKKPIQAQILIIFKENKSGLNTLQRVINQFRDIKAEAEKIKMIPEFAEIEVSLAKKFYRMRESQRTSGQQKIPIIILHRLMKTILNLRMKKEQQQQKAKQEDDGKAENTEKRANKRIEEQKEEEEFSDSGDCFDQDD